MNLPNKLTVLRIIMVPFFVLFMLTDLGGSANKWIALVLFCVASLTDMLDGKIARARNLVTNFGKFMDPQAARMLRHDLPHTAWKTGCVDRYRDHSKRIYHQRLPPCRFRQRNRYRSKLLGEVQDRFPDVYDHPAHRRSGRRV